MAVTFIVKNLDADTETAANMYDPEFTYYADGTHVVMRWEGGERRGVTFGMSEDRGPYAYQAVRWDDGGEDGVAPHVLHRDEEEAAEEAAPAVRDWSDCAGCSHGLRDVIGYAVAYSHASEAGVSFTDVAYLDGANQYGNALGIAREARAKALAGTVSATYAVVHSVYEGGHRPV